MKETTINICFVLHFRIILSKVCFVLFLMAFLELHVKFSFSVTEKRFSTKNKNNESTINFQITENVSGGKKCAGMCVPILRMAFVLSLTYVTDINTCPAPFQTSFIVLLTPKTISSDMTRRVLFKCGDKQYV